MPHRSDRGDLPSRPGSGHVGGDPNAPRSPIRGGEDPIEENRQREREETGGEAETIQDILDRYRDLVRSGEADRRAERLIRESLEAAGMGFEEIEVQLTAIFDSFDPATVAANEQRRQEDRESTQSITDRGDFEDEQTFNLFDAQEEFDPGGVFTRFLNEQLGSRSSVLRSGAERRSGDLFNQFTTGQLGGLVGLGKDAQPGDPALFFDFLRGQGPQGFNEPNLSTALGNIADVFRGGGTPTPGSTLVDERFINAQTGLTNQGRVAGAIGSNLQGSISPFLRSSFQGGIRNQLERLLASDPNANPFSAFQRGGFF